MRKRVIIEGLLVALIALMGVVQSSYAQPKNIIKDLDSTYAYLGRGGTVIDTTQLPLASAEQVAEFVKGTPSCGYFCLPESRQVEIRFDDLLLEQWMESTPESRASFSGEVRPGENYVWQVALFAPELPLEQVQMQISELTNAQGETIPTSAFECYTLGGVDKEGVRFTKEVGVGAGLVQQFWMGVEFPIEAQGSYTATLKVSPQNAPSTDIALTFFVAGEPLESGGVDQGWRLSRMKWLNSDIARSDEPTAPYTPLVLSGKSISYLGGEVVLTEQGLPAQITTHYDRFNQIDRTLSNEILARPITVVIETEQGIERLMATSIRWTTQNAAQLCWESRLTNKRFEVLCLGEMNFDGTMSYRLKVESLLDQSVKDIRLEVDVAEYASKYMMGLGRKGGLAPEEELAWKWDTLKHQDRIWVGNINAGVNLTFKDENYTPPLVNIYYEYGRLHYPNSWGNEDRGGITLSEGKHNRLINAYSGERTMSRGEVQHYNFDLTITPLRPIDYENHFKDRFFHTNRDTTDTYIEEAVEAGATAVTIHHRADIYPFINYPFVDNTIDAMKTFSDSLRSNELDLRLYYTCRELTVKTPEFWALRSMGDEFIYPGPGADTRTLIHYNGPNPWFLENFHTPYIPAWFTVFKAGRFKGELDVSVITTPESRWHNYYLEGLNWMIQHYGLRGVYIDDSSLDPQTIRRARRLMDGDGKRRLIDMHTWNHMCSYGGFANSIQQYLNLLPYVDRIWIGEVFRDDNPADFWLVEMSGIPFGQMSEMLHATNIFRGMSFGMLPRLPWSGNPVPMWNFLDRIDAIAGTLRGSWDERNPANSGNSQVLATTYLLPDKRALVVLANWSDDEPQEVNLKLHEHKLGFTPTKITLPAIEQTQSGGSFELGDVIHLPAKGGMFLLVE